MNNSHTEWISSRGPARFIDLLAVDGDGVVHVIELKRDKTPRDVVAQALDYGSWVAGLDRTEVLAIFQNYNPGIAFDTAFVESFGGDPPDELNLDPPSNWA